jgi:hypothetical protein
MDSAGYGHGSITGSYEYANRSRINSIKQHLRSQPVAYNALQPEQLPS